MNSKRELTVLYLLVCLLVLVIVLMYGVLPLFEKAWDNNDAAHNADSERFILESEIETNLLVAKENAETVKALERYNLTASQAIREISKTLEEKGIEIITLQVGQVINAEDSPLADDSLTLDEELSSELMLCEITLSLSGGYDSLCQAAEELSLIDGLFPCSYTGDVGDISSAKTEGSLKVMLLTAAG